MSITSTIENRIFTIRGKQVMLDSDLSMLFDVQVKRINEQVSRNLNRFPAEFAFQLTPEEWRLLKSQIATSIHGKGGKVKAPRAFTEHGIAMHPSKTWANAGLRFREWIVWRGK